VVKWVEGGVVLIVSEKCGKGVKSALDSYWGFLIEIGTCPGH
jgi:hypothetical protein